MHLRIGVQVADALDVDDQLAPPRVLKGEVRERVRRVANQLVEHEARVRAMLAEVAVEEGLGGKGQPPAAGQVHHPARDEVHRLGHGARVVARRVLLRRGLHHHVRLEQRGRVGVGAVVLRDKIARRAAPPATRAKVDLHAEALPHRAAGKRRALHLHEDGARDPAAALAVPGSPNRQLGGLAEVRPRVAQAAGGRRRGVPALPRPQLGRSDRCRERALLGARGEPLQRGADQRHGGRYAVSLHERKHQLGVELLHILEAQVAQPVDAALVHLLAAGLHRGSPERCATKRAQASERVRAKSPGVGAGLVSGSWCQASCFLSVCACVCQIPGSNLPSTRCVCVCVARVLRGN